MRPSVLAAIGLLAGLHVAADALWLGADDGVQYTDAAYHFTQVVELSEGLFGDTAARAQWAARDDHQRYGESWYYVAAGVGRITGLTPPALLLGLSVLLWPLLLGATWRLGEELAPPGRGPPAGLLAALWAGFLPGLFNYSHVLVLDLPLCAAVAWSTVGLLRAARAGQEGRPAPRGAWILAGVAGAAGVAIKINALAFLLGPLVVALLPALRRRWVSDRRAALGAVGLASTAGGALLYALASGHRLGALLVTARDATWPGKALDYWRAGDLSLWPRDWARAVLQQSWEVAYFSTLQTWSPPALLVTIVATLWFFARRRGCVDRVARAQRRLVFAVAAPALFGVIVLLRGLYDERYILPLLPLSAAVVAGSVFELPRPRLRALVAAGLVLGGALNFSWIAFDALPTTRPLACATVRGWARTPRLDPALWLCLGYPGYRFMDRSSAPVRSPWPLADVDQGLFATRERLQRPLKAVYLDDLYELFYRSLQRALLGDDLIDPDSILLITRCQDEAWMTAMFGSVEATERLIADADVVFMRYGAPEGGGPTLLGRRCRVFWPQRDHFSEGGARPLSDGTEIRWYLRKR